MKRCNVSLHFCCRKTVLLLVAALFTIFLNSGCSTRNTFSSGAKHFQFGESVVLVGEEPAQLAFAPLQKSIQVRSTYRNDLPQTIRYEAGRDFVIDYPAGQIRRTAQSRIPDFRTNLLYGVEDFDHGKFPGFGNGGFFAFVDYSFKSEARWPQQESQIEFLRATQQKLARGQTIKIVVFGDSISTGCDATEPSLIFWQRWAEALRKKYPRATIEMVNGATGGDTTRQGIERLSEKVLSQKPDLVLIGFGMNDHNMGGWGTPLEQFAENLRTMADRIRHANGAEIIFYSTFPPNPKWHASSKNMEAYALATARVARDEKCALADVYHNWLAISARKKPEDMLANNINHPNDFGHWIYFQVLEKLGL